MLADSKEHELIWVNFNILQFAHFHEGARVVACASTGMAAMLSTMFSCSTEAVTPKGARTANMNVATARRIVIVVEVLEKSRNEAGSKSTIGMLASG